MSNTISNDLKKEMYGQVSADPFLLLVTLSHPDFSSPIRLVNNTEDVVSRGETFIAFPMKISLPEDDGESIRDASITFDNVSGELIREMRKITTAIDATLETVLASDPNYVQIAYSDLKLNAINYNSRTILGKLKVDSFLNVNIPSETYTPTNFIGIF